MRQVTIMDIIDYLQEFNMVSVILRMLIATFLGALIGLERASKGQTAGVRTFALVCLGSAMATVANLYLFEVTGNTDTARIPAAVLNGIGFLGVGTIVVTGRNYVRGLTTAATLWATAALGVTIGSGYIIGSVTGFAVIIFIVIALSRASRHQEEKSSYITIYVEVDKDGGIQKLFDHFHEKEYDVVTLEKQKKATLKENDAGLLVSLDMKKHVKHESVIAEISSMDYVDYIEEIKR